MLAAQAVGDMDLGTVYEVLRLDPAMFDGLSHGSGSCGESSRRRQVANTYRSHTAAAAIWIKYNHMVGDRNLNFLVLTFYYGNEYDVDYSSSRNMFPVMITLVGSDLCCGPVCGASLALVFVVSRV
jgi:hypothetical protein